MKKVLSLMAVLLFLAFPIHATVTDTESPVKVYTSATVTAYPIPFDYIDDTDIEVTLVAIATGAETAQTLNVDYTIVSDTVTYSVAPGAAYKIIIRRVTPYTQEASWVSGSAPPLSAYESAFDKLTFLTQDLNERLRRALVQPEGAAYKDLALPDPAYNANKYLAVNAAGTKYEAVTPASGTISFPFAKLSDYASFNAMITAVGSTETTVYVDTSGTLSANTTILSTLHLVFQRGGAIVLGNYNLVFQCQPNAPPDVQIFNCSGTGTVTGLTEARPEWWGFSASASAATNTAALQGAASSLTAGGTLKIVSVGSASVNDKVTILSNTTVRGNPGLVIAQTVTNKQIFYASSKTNLLFYDLNLYGLGDWAAGRSTESSYLGRGIDLVGCTAIRTFNCNYKNFDLAAAYFLNCSDVEMVGGTIKGTHEYSAAIAAGDNYQFGVCFNSNTSGTWLAHDFRMIGVDISGVCQGVESSPISGTDVPYNVDVSSGNNIHDIPGQHAAYFICSHLNFTGNLVSNTKSDAVKYSTNTYDVSDANFTGNTLSGCGFGNGLEIGSVGTGVMRNITVGPNAISGYNYAVVLDTNVKQATVTGGAWRGNFADGLRIKGTGMENIKVDGPNIKYSVGNGANVTATGTDIDLSNLVVANSNMRSLAFTTGVSALLAENAAIEGASSGATATVIAVKITSGTVAGGDAAGTMLLADQTGNFSAENITVGTTTVAAVGGDSSVWSYSGMNMAGGTRVRAHNCTVVDSESNQVYAFYQASSANLSADGCTFSNGATSDVRLDAYVDEWLGNTYSSITGMRYLRSSGSLKHTKQSTTSSNVTAFEMLLEDESAYMITAEIVGKLSGSGERACYKETALFYRNGGNATQEGATDTDVTIESASFAGVHAWAVSGSNVRINCNSGGTADYDWEITTRYTKVVD